MLALPKQADEVHVTAVATLPYLDHEPISSTTEKLIHSRAEAIVRDRFRTADPAVFGKKLVLSPSYEIVLNSSFVALFIFPKSDAQAIERRVKRYGTAIPFLLDRDHESIPPNEDAYLFRFRNEGRSSFSKLSLSLNDRATSAFQLGPDSALGLRDVGLRIPSKGIDYAIPVLFSLAFGPSKRLRTAHEDLDSLASFYITSWSNSHYLSTAGKRVK